MSDSLSSKDDVLLRAHGAAFGYGGKPIISGVDLVVRAGTLIGIAGPNGAGKTTLFRGLLGLIKPLSGRVERFGHTIGYVSQREVFDAVFPLTVMEVVQLGAVPRFTGLQRFWRGLDREQREYARACLEQVGLAERHHKAFASLSGGQRQRVLIARALMSHPRLLVLDEPTSGVDREAERRILELLLELERDEGLAVLIVSHELQLLREVASQVLWVADGRVRQGDAETLLDPATLDRLFAGTTAGDT